MCSARSASTQPGGGGSSPPALPPPIIRLTTARGSATTTRGATTSSVRPSEATDRDADLAGPPRDGGHHRAEPDLHARVVPSVGKAPDERAVALADPVRRVAVVVLRRFVLGQSPGTQPRQVGGVEPLEILDHSLEFARAGEQRLALADQVGHRAIGAGAIGLEQRRQRGANVRHAPPPGACCRDETGTPLLDLGDGLEREPRLADQLHQLRRHARGRTRRRARREGSGRGRPRYGCVRRSGPWPRAPRRAARPRPAVRPRRAPRCRLPGRRRRRWASGAAATRTAARRSDRAARRGGRARCRRRVPPGR